MIVVAAKVAAKPGKRAEFIRHAQPVIAATRKEEGCISYQLYASTENEVDLFYFELWTSRAALDGHLNSDHLKKWGQTKIDLDLAEGPSDVTVYDVAQ